MRIMPEPASLIDDFYGYLHLHRYAPGTFRSYYTVLRELGGILNGRPITETAPADIEAWHIEQDRLGNSAGTILRKQGCLSVLFKWLCRHGQMMKDPTASMVRPHVPERLPSHLAPTQVRRLLQSLRGETFDDLRQMAVVQTLAHTGMRPAELLRLDVEDWDRESSLLKIVGKREKERLAYVSPELEIALGTWLKVHPTGMGALFCFPSGRRMSYQVMRGLVNSAFERAGMKGGALVLRHTYATQAWKKKVPLEEIQLLLGHSQIQTTLVYVHTNVSEKTRRKLDRMF